MGQQQGAQQAPHATSGAQQQQQQQRVAGQQGAGHAAPAPAADPGPVLPDTPEEALQVWEVWGCVGGCMRACAGVGPGLLACACCAY